MVGLAVILSVVFEMEMVRLILAEEVPLSPNKLMV